MSALTNWVAPTLTNGGIFQPFSNLVENFFGRDIDDFFKMPKSAFVPAVNIIQSDKKYTVEVAAPGLKKEDFKIEVEDGVLTISAEKETEAEDKNKKFTRMEYSYNAFCRSFSLPESVKATDVKAHYEDGILKIDVPKIEVEKRKALPTTVAIS
jgi:HSP20 family protein